MFERALMLRGLRVCRLDLIKNGLGSNISLDLVQFGINLRLHAHAVGDCRHEADELGDLVLGKKTDMQVKVGALVGRRGHAVLTDQHEG